jgi:hypothetical protein
MTTSRHRTAGPARRASSGRRRPPGVRYRARRIDRSRRASTRGGPAVGGQGADQVAAQEARGAGDGDDAPGLMSAALGVGAGQVGGLGLGAAQLARRGLGQGVGADQISPWRLDAVAQAQDGGDLFGPARGCRRRRRAPGPAPPRSLPARRDREGADVAAAQASISASAVHSRSCGQMLRPLRMIRSLPRPVMTISPSIRKPRSPVSSQPSADSTRAVSSGCSKYSRIRLGPRRRCGRRRAPGRTCAVLVAHFQEVVGRTGPLRAKSRARSEPSGARRPGCVALQALDVQGLGASGPCPAAPSTGPGSPRPCRSWPRRRCREAGWAERLGEGLAAAGADHVAAQAGAAPVERSRCSIEAALGAAGAQLVAEGRAVADRAAVVG